MSESKTIDQDSVIRLISCSPLTDNRTRVKIDLSENTSKPNLKLTLIDAKNREVSRTIILGPMNGHIEFTMHVRVPDAQFPLLFTCTTFVEEGQPIYSKSITVPDN